MTQARARRAREIERMENAFGIAALWYGLALIATFLASRLKVSGALMEILVGVGAAAIIGRLFGPDTMGSNIAEGFKKRGRLDKLRFYNIAQGSVEEISVLSDSRQGSRVQRCFRVKPIA